MDNASLRSARSNASYEARFGRCRNVIDEDKAPNGQPLPLSREPIPMWKILMWADKAADRALWQGYDKVAQRNRAAGRPTKCAVCFCLLPVSGVCCGD